jgi:serine/threonine protein kinase
VAPPPPPPEPEPALDYRHLAPDTQLGRKYRVQSKLGEGSFGVVYKVIDTLADRTIAMKIILRDRYSVIERLKKEFRALSNLPDHPNVVKVFYPDYLPNEGPPFIAFAYVEGGIDVKDMVKDRLFSPKTACGWPWILLPDWPTCTNTASTTATSNPATCCGPTKEPKSSTSMSPSWPTK